MQRIVSDPAQRRKILTVVVVLLMCAGLWWWQWNARQAQSIADLVPPDLAAPEAAVADPTSLPTPTVLTIAVDVIGAVQQPGVYFLQPTARITDAVTAAGGLAPNADRLAVNMAARLTDAQQIRIPHVGESTLTTPEPLSSAVEAATSVAATVNINTADGATLATLPGIGPAMAQRIIEYRTANGRFASVEDLQNVRGIGPSIFAELKDYVRIDDLQ